MSRPVKKVPQLPLARPSTNVTDLARFNANLIAVLYKEFYDHAIRLNNALQKDGTEAMDAPMPVQHSTVVELPALHPAADWEGALLYISNEAGGKTIAFSDGVDWRRVQDRNIVT